MAELGDKILVVKCPKCRKSIKGEVVSEHLGTPSIKGVKIFKEIKLKSHKKEGIFSSKCINSDETLTYSIWHPSNKVKKIRCRSCRNNVSAFIISTNSWNNGYHRPVTKKIVTTTFKILYHKRGLVKCRGTGKIIKEKQVDFIDNDHP